MQRLDIDTMPAADKALLEEAMAAREKSYSPYSHFAVGAAVRSADSGKLYQGTNIENASYGLTVCAERNGIFAAVGAGERHFDAICVVADLAEPVSPCGACRQVMAEFKIKRILLANLQGDIAEYTLEELLPYGFEL